MKWLTGIAQSGRGDSGGAVDDLRDKFRSFQTLLGNHNRVLKTIADMVEQAQGEHLIDADYLQHSVATLREGVADIIEAMVILGGERYAVLKERFRDIDSRLKASRVDDDILADTPICELLRGALEHIAPMNLLNPADPDFTPENCLSFNDIAHFCHQMAVEEMFVDARAAGEKGGAAVRLKSDIPLQVDIIQLDREPRRQKTFSTDELGCPPLEALWSGILEQGWPAAVPHLNLSGFMSVMTTQVGGSERAEFSQNSYALISREYMMLSLRMGYHFTTFEAMCSDAPGKNYVRMQHKGGGAALERRMRRVALLGEVLAALEFENRSRGDFLEAILTHTEASSILNILKTLGRLTILTKQLDMALSNDSIARWYTDDILKKLGLTAGRGG